MKECVICNAEFEPYVSHAKFCSNACKNTNVRNKRKLKAEALPKKKCLFCNEEVNRPRKYKYCSDKCHKAMNCKKVCDRAREEVRKNHAKKPPKYCKTCNVRLITTVRNYHVLEFCPPCRKQNDREKKLKFNEENKERLTTYFKENHAKKMQDPEYREMVRLRSIENRAKQPKTFVDCLVCGKNFQRDRYNKNCSKECSKKWLEIRQQKPVNRLSGRLNLAMRRVLDGRRNRDNIWKYFGFTVEELKKRLESLFTNGMSWDNMSGWHIDHIRPKASFCQVSLCDTNSEDFKKCWALNNLQPLWAVDNIRKSDKWDGKVNA